MDTSEIELRTIDGQQQRLSDYRGKALLIVNVASFCGKTPQYAGLQSLYERNRERGLEVLAFPCNQFGAQEPGSADEIKEFCTSKYAVTFPLFEKGDVNGPKRMPLYEYLTSQPTSPEGPGDITWNFTKFIVDRQGKVVARFSPNTKPEDAALISAVDNALLTLQ